MIRKKTGWRWCLETALIVLLANPMFGQGQAAAQKPASADARRSTRLDLSALMTQFKPPYVPVEAPRDKAITFERVDVIIEQGLSRWPGTYLSIGGDGSYLYSVETVELPPGKQRPGARLVGRLPPPRLAELEKLLDDTQWLTAPGGQGAATHTDAGLMKLAVTRDGTLRTITLEGQRPVPYTALQKFFEDLLLQESIYHRLTILPDEQRQALGELHDAIESALGRPGRQTPQHEFTFERYHDLFAMALNDWHVKQTDELRTAIDLMVLLKRRDHAAEISRLRNDRDLNLRTTVAVALPALLGQESIPLLEEMIDSTEEARFRLVELGEPAVPAIAAFIERDETRSGSKSVGLIRAYIDHWKEVPQPIDPRVIAAVKANMQLESVRSRGFGYHRELLQLAGEPEPKPPTALETAQSWVTHLQSGNAAELGKIVSNVAKPADWLKLRESFSPKAQLALDKIYVDKTSGLLVTKPFQDKVGQEIRLFVFMNLLRGTDWRVGPALAQPAQRELYRERFLKDHPGASEIVPK